MLSFKDKVVVVTGAGSGMGRAYAIEFSKLGAKLALNDYDRKGLDETINIIKTATPNIQIHDQTFDVSNADAMFDFASQTKSVLGNAHVVINNAGVEANAKPFALLELNQFKRIMDINFYGVLHGCKAFIPQLIENNEGALVNISSLCGLVGMPNMVDYCASKFAVRGLTEALALELNDSPISVHCVHPGGVSTNINRLEGAQAFHKHYLSTPPEVIAKKVIRAIQTNKPKIVAGNQSFRTWLGSNLLPQRLLNFVLWRELKPLTDTTEYHHFIKNFKS